MKKLFSFPHPVNEYSSRCVAAGVLILCCGVVFFSQMWILPIIAYGFIARVATGPSLSPLGQLVTRVIIPALKWKPKYVPGPPKRFAQGIGAVLSCVAVILWLAIDNSTPARIVTSFILIAASLEALFGLCLGCVLFSWLMKLRIIPQSMCEACVLPNNAQ